MTAIDTAVAIAVVGVGKIARDQHLPSIEKSAAFKLAAVVSRHATVEGVENFTTIEALLNARPDISAVALCMPPQARFEAACAAIRAGRHVLLEKPPGATVSEVQALVQLAKAQGVALFATWHSRFAAGVEPARKWLKDRKIAQVTVTWKEDVRRWHPGQDWIWQPGGVGVFDPGINALSILAEILPHPIHVTAAELDFPENRDAPIGARIDFTSHQGASVAADFDWRQTGPQTWDIDVETTDGRMRLSAGGAVLELDGKRIATGVDGEYDGLYGRFAKLIANSEIDVDLTPLIHVADAFMLAKRLSSPAFHDQP